MWVTTTQRLKTRVYQGIALSDHPVYLNTVNEPLPGYGLYTDCLIPA